MPKRRAITTVLLLALSALAACAAEAPPPQTQAAEAQPAQSQPSVTQPQAVEAQPTQVQLQAADGVAVFGTYYPAAAPKALILLFHQAGANRGEYATIAPRLVEAGYSALAIDQRSGGGMFDTANATVDKLGHSADYLDALQDLEAALAWAHADGRDAPVLVWGSSYSAALVFLLADRHPGEIDAVLAFSPGEYLGQPRLVRDAAARVTAPVYVTSAKDDEEIAAAKGIVDATASSSRTQFVPGVAGVHGSSTLRADRDPKGMDENWQAVMAFLAGLDLSR